MAAPERQTDLHPVTHEFGKSFRPRVRLGGDGRSNCIFSVLVPQSVFIDACRGRTLIARNAALSARANSLLYDRLNAEVGSKDTMAAAMSAYIYNEIEDYKRFAAIIRATC